MFVISKGDVATSTDTTAPQAPLVVATTSTLYTEQAVRSYFKDTPLLIDIARCESHFKQFDADGGIHRGRVNNKDVGVMQINEYYHLETAQKMGINIYTLEGNMKYAKDLYDRLGSQPWISSSPCWNKTQVASK